MRRRPGIAGLQRDVNARAQYRATGEEVRKATAAEMAAQLALFRTRLERFAADHKAEVRADPAFRAQFHAMCASVGVDPLASGKSLWAELLGLGDYYYELGVTVLEACLASRPHNGGLMELGALRAAVARRRGAAADPISEDDIARAIRKLKALGGGLDLVTIGRASYVRSVPGELNLDKNRALEAAQASNGRLSRAELCERTGWDAPRAAAVLEGLAKEGLALVDDGDPSGCGRLWWFPALSASAMGGSVVAALGGAGEGLS